MIITTQIEPKIPVVYDEAVNALVACASIDEAKYWNSKAEALAAWAKIYRDDQVGIEAKRLKLHAYRRMGQIAYELAPLSANRRTKPRPILMREGLSSAEASSAARIARIARMKEKDFEKIVNMPRPFSPHRVRKLLEPGTEAYKKLCHEAGGLFSFRSFCRRTKPREVAALESSEKVRALEAIKEIAEWLDEVDQRLKVVPVAISKE